MLWQIRRGLRQLAGATGGQLVRVSKVAVAVAAALTLVALRVNTSTGFVT